MEKVCKCLSCVNSFKRVLCTVKKIPLTSLSKTQQSINTQNNYKKKKGKRMGSFRLLWPFGKSNGSPKHNHLHKESTHRKDEDDEAQLEEFGVTQQLIDYVKGFTINAFKDYPLQDDQSRNQIDGSAPNVSNDLTEWQERHATLVLSKVKELSQLRYVLCPRHLKDRQFWRIYFLLVKNYVSPYEIRALTKAKLRLLKLQNEKSDKAAIEVEMTDTKHASGSSLLQHDSEILADEN